MSDTVKNSPSGPARSEEYKIAGVDLDAGEEVGRLTGEICRNSYRNSPFVTVTDMSLGNFRGPRSFHFHSLPAGFGMTTAPDGIGTKTILLSVADACEGAITNLFEMTGFDIVRYGGLPLVFINILEAKTLGKPGSVLFKKFEGMLRTMGVLAASQNYVLLNGETAQMSHCVSSEFNGAAAETLPIFNWSGVMIGAMHPDKLINGSSIRPGMRAIALADGLRSNGASQCRRFLREAYGQEWWNNEEAMGVVAEMSQESALYSRFMSILHGWYAPDFKPILQVHGIAHLSGGSLRTKLVEGLLAPAGLTVELDNLWDPPQFMYDCIHHFKMSDEEAYTIFNGGQGAIVFIDEADVEKFTNLAAYHDIASRDAGGVTAQGSSGGKAIVTSKFSDNVFTLTA